MKMGELLDQILAGGPPLAPLNKAQQALFYEQLHGDPLFIRWIFYELEALEDAIEEGVHQFCAENPYNSSTAFFHSDYKNYVVLTKGGRDKHKPLNEEDFRMLLGWTGHGPAFVSPHWVKLFTRAVETMHPEMERKEANRQVAQVYLPNVKKVYHAFLYRMVEAAKNVKEKEET
jgi:hypothetical protein